MNSPRKCTRYGYLYMILLFLKMVKLNIIYEKL